VDAYVLSWEDACLPVDLRFSPPLVEHGWPGPFEYHWQLLTFEFSLPDPADFPPLTGFSTAEIAELERYATVCGELAGRAALRHHGGMAVNAISGAISYEPVTAPRATFEGFSLRFRQIHCAVDGPGFDSVAATLSRHALQADDARSGERLSVLAQWTQARTKLRERPLRNLVARSMLRMHRRPESEANYDGVRPDDVFAQLDFGRLIAINSAVTTAEEHVFLVSALGLCHLYFGFALLVRSALGSD
jgi:hypothetical protein